MNGVKNAGSPLIAAISGYDDPEMVCAIVQKPYDNWDLIIPTLSIKFLGYFNSCTRQLSEYPDSNIVHYIKDKII